MKIQRKIKRKIKSRIKGEIKYRLIRFLLAAVATGAICSFSGCSETDISDAVSYVENITGGVTTEAKGTEIYTYDLSEESDAWEYSEKSTENGKGTGNEDEIPAYSGSLSVVINDNIPDLDKKDAETGIFIKLSELDELGRCGTAYMCAGPETLATEERGEIGHVKPSGWHTVKYPDVIPERYLYNRSHLLMYALSGLNDDERNLITGTRQLNADTDAGMLHYEDIVLDYIEDTGNHVLYRVTPVFTGDNLLADGVHMEALSVEDDTISFNVFVYNVQNGINIDYATGDSVEK